MPRGLLSQYVLQVVSTRLRSLLILMIIMTHKKNKFFRAQTWLIADKNIMRKVTFPHM